VFELVAQAIVSGLAVGCIYGLIGIGFCVIYNASGIVNFAQGAFVMLGGMLAFATREFRYRSRGSSRCSW
jgi:branched-chain amino acid transport system permease protein